MDTTNTIIDWVARDTLFPNPANPRQNDAAVGPVRDSLRRFGWQQPIVAKESGEIVAGHTRLRAAEELGMETVPVIRFDGTDLDAVAFGIADNRTHEFSAWMEPELAKLLAQLAEEDALEGVGYSEEEVALLLRSQEPEKELSDPAPGDAPEEPVSRPGDLWVLGAHRFFCGDSREVAAYERLLKGESADMIWTDPPFGVSYHGKAGEIQNDSHEGLRELLEHSLGTAVRHCRDGAVWYVAAPAGPQFLDFAQVLTDLGVWRQTLVWVKNSLVLGHSDFHYRHEALFYGWSPGGEHRPPPDRKQDTVWEFNRPAHSPDHPTMKPVELVDHAIDLSSSSGDLVLDPFLGSGTTLIASEQLGRRCRGFEIDPRYADVVVRRWQDLTGKEVVLEETGASFAVVEGERKA